MTETTPSRVVGSARGGLRLLAAAAVLIVVEIGLRFGSVAGVARRLGIGLEPDASVIVSNQVPARLYHRIGAARRVVALRGPRGRCLRESLVVGALCRSAHPVLRLGVDRVGTNGVLAAHAWIELEGVSYDLEAMQFAPLLRIGTV